MLIAEDTLPHMSTKRTHSPSTEHGCCVRRSLRSALVAAVSLGLGSPAVAQATGTAAAAIANGAAAPASTLAYDVASIRPNRQGPGSVRVSTNLDVYLATNVSLTDLLRDAFDLRPGMLAGQPKWAEDNRFDIHAKILDATVEQLKGITPEDRRRMLGMLLADRFHLVTHTELKTLAVYELLQGKGGAKFTAIAPEHRNDAFHDVSSGGMSIHNGQLIGHYLPLTSLANSLSYQVDRPVLDKTGLTGRYNLQLTWTRDEAPVADDAGPPPLFKALEEQLGLRLDSARDPVQVLVVDHAELPTEN